jgi:hypothetical protein
LISHYLQNSFTAHYRITFGLDFVQKDFEIEDHLLVSFNCGMFHAKRLQRSDADVLPGSVGAMIVFDISRPNTLEATAIWKRNIVEYIEINVKTAQNVNEAVRTLENGTQAPKCRESASLIEWNPGRDPLLRHRVHQQLPGAWCLATCQLAGRALCKLPSARRSSEYSRLPGRALAAASVSVRTSRLTSRSGLERSSATVKDRSMGTEFTFSGRIYRFDM